MLVIPSPEDSFILYTDASGSGVGGCLHVIREEKELPVGFFSRQLNSAENNYSVSELESLAIVASLKHFEYYIYTKQVVVATDHKPCLALMEDTSLNKCLLRFALSLQQFQVTIVCRPGKSHLNADGMSRQAWTEADDEAAQCDVSASPSSQILVGGDVGGEDRVLETKDYKH